VESVENRDDKTTPRPRRAFTAEFKAGAVPKRTWSDIASATANPERAKVIQQRLGLDAAVAGPRSRAVETPAPPAAATRHQPAA
jgi:hypothetical protein